MFLRYRLSVYYHEVLLYEKYLKSINQVVKIANGFHAHCVFYCDDLLTDSLLDHDFILELVKEFKDYD